MRELPILFSAPMVRAILEGRKTVTRRVVKPQLELGYDLAWQAMPALNGKARYRRVGADYPDTEKDEGIVCPYGVGDRLHVRETTVNVEDHGYLGPVFAASDEGAAIREGGLGPGEDDCEIEPEDIRLGTALHMPKAWARIWLEVTAVRVERLQDVTPEQAIAEGVVSHLREHDAVVDLRQQFADLWDGLAKDGTRWADNPWVWVVEFQGASGGER